MKRINKYTEQQREWFRLKGLCILVRNQTREERSNNIERLHRGVREYYNQYRTKFNYSEMPK